MDNNRFSSFFGGNADKWIGGFIGLILALDRAGIWDLTDHFHPGLRGGWCVLWLQKGKQREIFQIGAGIVFP